MSTRVFVIIAGTLLIAVILPVLLLKTLPFTDLPNHLAEAIILQDLRQGGYGFVEYFDLSRLTFYQPGTGHAIVCSLFSDVEFGNRLLYVLYCLSLPLLVVVLIRMNRGCWEIGLLAVLLIWNCSATWGFSGYTLSIPLMLLLLLFQARYAYKTRKAYFVILMLLFVVLYWVHAQMFLFALLTFVLFEIVLRTSGTLKTKESLKRIAIPVPAVVLLVLWLVHGEEHRASDTFVYLREYYSKEYFEEFAERLRLFFILDWEALVHYKYKDMVSYSISSVIVLPAALSIMRRKTGENRTLVVNKLLICFALLSIACYLLLPQSLPGQYHINERFSALCYIGFIGILGSRPGVYQRYLRVTRLLVILAVGVYVILWGRYFWQYKDIEHGFEAIVHSIPGSDERNVGYMIGDPFVKDRAALIHFYNYEIIWTKSMTYTCVGNYLYGFMTQRYPEKEYHDWLCYYSRDDIAAVLDSYGEFTYLIVSGSTVKDVIRQSGLYVEVGESERWEVFRKIQAVKN